MMPPNLFILTDYDGRTVCVLEQGSIFAEATRVPLRAPIAIVHWALHGTPYNRSFFAQVPEWRRGASWLWDGSLETLAEMRA